MKKKNYLQNKTVKNYINKRLFALLAFSILFIVACTSDSENIQNTDVTVLTTFNFTHDWDGALVTNSDFNNFQFTITVTKLSNGLG